MNSDHGTGDSRSFVSSSPDASPPAPAAEPAHDDMPSPTDAHLGAVDSETTLVVPPMRGSDDAEDDLIDPDDEITPG